MYVHSSYTYCIFVVLYICTFLLCIIHLIICRSKTCYHRYLFKIIKYLKYKVQTYTKISNNYIIIKSCTKNN